MNEQQRQRLIAQYYTTGAIIFLVLAVLAVKAMVASTFQVVTNYWTANPLLSQKNTIFAPASHVMWDIEFRWVLVLILLLSVIVPVAYVYLASTDHKKIDLRRHSFIDWLVTSSLILTLIAVLAGVQDFMTLILIVGINIAAYCLIWKGDHNRDKNPSALAGYGLGVCLMILPWLLIVIYSIATWTYGDVRSPWFVYVLDILGLAYTGLFVYGYFWLKNNTTKRLVSNELYPILFNQFVKVFFALILITGLKR